MKFEKPKTILRIESSTGTVNTGRVIRTGFIEGLIIHFFNRNMTFGTQSINGEGLAECHNRGLLNKSRVNDTSFESICGMNTGCKGPSIEGMYRDMINAHIAAYKVSEGDDYLTLSSN